MSNELTHEELKAREAMNQELNRTCPFLSSSKILDSGEIQIANVPCLGEQCAMWSQVGDHFGICSIRGANYNILLQDVNVNDGSSKDGNANES